MPYSVHFETSDLLVRPGVSSSAHAEADNEQDEQGYHADGNDDTQTDPTGETRLFNLASVS